MNEIHTHTSVSRDHPSLAGHFPGQPIVPGVVLLDLVLDAIRSGLERDVRLQSIPSTKFLQAVAPEARLELQIKLTNDVQEPGRVKARFTATHNDKTVLEGSFLLEIPEHAQ